MDNILEKYLPHKQEANVGLFNDCFPPVMDGVAVCVENYAKWMQKMAGAGLFQRPCSQAPSVCDRNS